MQFGNGKWKPFLYVHIQRGRTANKDKRGTRGLNVLLPSPVGGLWLSAGLLDADAVSGIMLSIAFRQLCCVEKVTFGFLLNNC